RFTADHKYRAGACRRRSCQPGNTASGRSAGGVLFELRSARRRRVSVGQAALGGERIKPTIAEQVRFEGERAEHVGKHCITYVEPAGECAEGRHDQAVGIRRKTAPAHGTTTMSHSCNWMQMAADLPGRTRGQMPER